jgi:phage/plasmid-like protein (TIGR03299 family)
MFSVGAKPWHGLGHTLAAAPSIREGIVLAGMNWRVSLRPMFTSIIDGGTILDVPDHRAVWREDTGTILGVVGDGFHVLQNEDAFAFFQPLVDDGLVTLETAGVLREGRRVWVMAKIAGDPAVIVPGADDIVDLYALLCHGHDGSLAVRIGSNRVRVVCANTLAAALDEGDGLAVIKHTSGMASAMATARTVLTHQIELFRGSAEGWRFLASRTCTDADFTAYALRVVSLVRGASDERVREVTPDVETGGRILRTLRPLFEGGLGNDRPGVRGTWWAAYNAITQWLTHERGAATGTDRERAERRFAELHLGAGRRLGQRALMLALEGAVASAPVLVSDPDPGAPIVHLPIVDVDPEDPPAANDPADGDVVLDPDLPVIPAADPVDGAA